MEYCKEALPGFRSPLKRFNKINLLLKDQGLLSRTSTMSFSLTKIATNKLFPTSLIVTPCGKKKKTLILFEISHDLPYILYIHLIDFGLILGKLQSWSYSFTLYFNLVLNLSIVSVWSPIFSMSC